MPARKWTPEQRKRQSEKIHSWQPWTIRGEMSPEAKQRVSRNAYKGAPRATIRKARVIATLIEEDAQLLAQTTHETP
jgi:hypothetical protein